VADAKLAYGDPLKQSAASRCAADTLPAARLRLAEHLIDVLHVTPILRISILKPECAGSDVGRHMLDVAPRRRRSARPLLYCAASFNRDSEAHRPDQHPTLTEQPAIHGLVLPQCFQGYRQRTQYGLPTRRLPGTSGSRTGTLAGGGCLRQSPRHEGALPKLPA
jgi:hypothetical protein